ncbi:hypothetical protein CDL15_Pgr013708 [Punica granatum]|uniref:Glycoside hydrolase family 19 catalytic domain-containing protein n=1 Tax=Punica granatum TaxID=22663 RepID=A0A218W2M8_PUNGR|nr:hypothetical protein CDL15_Pgr013708 [Punica granatum]
MLKLCCLILLPLVSLSVSASRGRVQSEDISEIISRDLFNEMLKHRNDAACPAKGFYTYDAFIAATNVITEQWTPSNADSDAGRELGYGVITNIINGGIECGKPTPSQVQDRIGFYKRYCDLLQVEYGNSLDCSNQSPFA